MVRTLLRAGLGGLAAIGLALIVMAGAATAQSTVPSGTGQVMTGEKYIPTIWIDPDGCEHWVMDDGAEGYMDIRLDRQGHPICHRAQTCLVMGSDTLFATASAVVSEEGRRRLQAFFAQNGSAAYEVDGHTDSRGSDAYNMGLSQRRARSVAAIARASGARVAAVRGFGERRPIATNATAAGMAQNRRVEIKCIQ